VPRTTKPRPTTKKGTRSAKRPSASAPTRRGPTPAEAGPRDDEDGETPSLGTDPDDEGEGTDSIREVGAADPAPELGEEEDDEPVTDVDADGPGTDDDVSPSLPKSSKAAEVASIERFDPLSAYLREVQKHPLLPPEETQALAERFVTSQDPHVAARLVTSNLRLVVKIAYEYRRAYKNIMDLIQEGNIGLMQAVKRYDPYRGVKLSSYAAWWIRAYILRFILNNWRLVKLGTTQAQRKLFFNLRKKRAELQAMGVDPTNEEIARQLNVPESEVADMEVRLQASERSLDAPIGDGEGRSTAKIDTMASLVEGPEARVADSELQGLLKEKLASFRETLIGREKELAIFDARLVSDEPLTLQELGDRFGISRERVRQLEQRLTGRLREFLRDEMGDAVEVA
jgi:RNA polymerase sigma-32 factor